MAQAGNDSAEVERERRRLEERVTRVRKGLIDGVLDNETAKVAIQEAQAALAALPKPDGAAFQAGEMLTGIRELWPHMTAEERRDLLRLVLARVDIDLRTGSVNGLIPKPAFAPLFRVLAEEEGGLISVCGWRPRGDENKNLLYDSHVVSWDGGYTTEGEIQARIIHSARSNSSLPCPRPRRRGCCAATSLRHPSASAL